MDNLAHTLCGAALAKTGLGRQSRLAFASLLIGANLPDIDVVVRLFGDQSSYLVHHRGITHSLFGIAIETVLLAALVRACERWLERRAARAQGPGAAVPPPLPWRAYLLPALAGLLSHLVLDALNTYGVRPFLPFSSARYYADLLFIVDPLLWLLLAAIAALAGPRSRSGNVCWMVLAAAVSWFVYTHPRTPDQVRWYWPFALALVFSLRTLGVGRLRPRLVLIAGTCLVALYLGGLELSARLAWRNAERVREPVAQIAAGIEEPWSLAMRSPILADPFRWTFTLQGDSRYYVRDIDIHGEVQGLQEIRRGLGDPRVHEAVLRPEAAAWRYFSRLPWAWVREDEGRTVVELYDARYQFLRGPSWCAFEVELPRSATPSAGGAALPSGMRGP